jgi:hypothetical protein
MTGFDAVDGSPQRHRNVPVRDSDSPAATAILAFAERQLLAISCRQWVPLITTGMPPTPDMGKFGTKVAKPSCW